MSTDTTETKGKNKEKSNLNLSNFGLNTYEKTNLGELESSYLQTNYYNTYKSKEKIIMKQHKTDELKLIKETGNCFFSFLLILFYICLIFYFFIFKRNNSFKNFEKISSFNGRYISMIEKYKNTNYIKDMNQFCFSFYKFASFSYKRRITNNTFPESFMNWDIIQYGEISNDNYYYIFKNDEFKQIIIAFPGTLNIFQLIEEGLGSFFEKFDLNSSDILISKYFGERALLLLKIIFTEKINTLLNNNYKIITTGHSLGGAIAQAFMFFAIKYKKINITSNSPIIITYAQPKVGNQNFVYYLEKNSHFILRFLKKDDIVPKIPFFNLGFLNFINYIFGKNKLYNEYKHTKNAEYMDKQNYDLYTLNCLNGIIFFFILYQTLFYLIIPICYINSKIKIGFIQIITIIITILFLFLLYFMNDILFFFVYYILLNIASLMRIKKFKIIIGIFNIILMIVFIICFSKILLELYVVLKKWNSTFLFVFISIIILLLLCLAINSLICFLVNIIIILINIIIIIKNDCKNFDDVLKKLFKKSKKHILFIVWPCYAAKRIYEKESCHNPLTGNEKNIIIGIRGAVYIS